MNKIEKMNCIIAKEVMGWEERKVGSRLFYVRAENRMPFSHELKFHNDYNWLMKAIENIERRGFKVTIEGDYTMGTRNRVSIHGVGKFNKEKQQGDFSCDLERLIDTPFKTVPESDKYFEKTGITPKMEIIHLAVFQFADYYNKRKA